MTLMAPSSRMTMTSIFTSVMVGHHDDEDDDDFFVDGDEDGQTNTK